MADAEQQQQQQQQQVIGEDEMPQERPEFAAPPARHVYTAATDKIMKILNSNRASVDSKNEAEFRALAESDASYETYAKLLLKYDIPDWDMEYSVLCNFLSEIAPRQQATNMPFGGAFPGQPRITMTVEEIILICSCRGPLRQTGHLLFGLLQQGYTHVAILTTDVRGVTEVSLAAFARHMMRSLRAEKPYGYYGTVDVVPIESRAEIYPHFIEFLSYVPVPVKEATLTIKCIMKDLKEHAENPESDKLHTKGSAIGTPLHPWQFWRLQRGMRAVMWNTLSALMHAPATEGQPPHEGDEASRPTQLEDPESGYWVNKGDAFLKSVELGQNVEATNNASQSVGIHPKEFSALGFPQLYPPTLGNFGPVATGVACASILVGIIGLRIWRNQSTPSLN